MKKIYNPVTGKTYPVKEGTGKQAKVKGLWSRKRKGLKKLIEERLEEIARSVAKVMNMELVGCTGNQEGDGLEITLKPYDEKEACIERDDIEDCDETLEEMYCPFRIDKIYVVFSKSQIKVVLRERDWKEVLE